MTTYDTGNPVPSGDARDRFDNTQTLDEVVTGSNDTAVTRLGGVLQTLKGMNNSFNQWLINSAFESTHLTYVVGTPLTVLRSTQLIDYNGSVYRVKMPASFPVNLTGVWATDSPNLVDVGDASLRTSLAAPAGAQLVGYSAANTYPAATVGFQLNTLNTAIASANTAIANNYDFADYGAFGKAMAKTRVRANVSAAPYWIWLGDSISHGAYAVDIFRNGCVNLVKRAINQDFGGTSYGFTPLFSMPNGALSSQDIHEIAFSPTGAWQFMEGPTGTHVMQGVSCVSTAVGSTISSTIPCFQDRAYIWWIGNPGGGTFNVTVNGTVLATVNTAASSVTQINVQVVPLTANQAGDAVIQCVTTTAGKVEICGFSYMSGIDGVQVNNFSNSGRRLRWLDESTINAMLNPAAGLGGTACFVMALGINDSGDNLTDPAYFTAFKQRIDWIIQYANTFEVPVVVPDFIWFKGTSDPTRMELKRLATATGGVYIPYPDLLQKSGLPTTQAYRRDVLKMWTDDYHPISKGHQWIFEVFAKRLGLSCTSKKIVLDNYDWWYPLKIAATGITSLGQTSSTVSAVRNNGSGNALCRLNFSGMGTLTAGSRGVQLAWPSRAGIQQASVLQVQLAPRTDGGSNGTVLFAAGGNITAQPNAQNNSTSTTMTVVIPTVDHGAA